MIYLKFNYLTKVFYSYKNKLDLYVYINLFKYIYKIKRSINIQKYFDSSGKNDRFSKDI